MRWRLILLGLIPAAAYAGGGVALQDDQCLIAIEFYTAHFTAYQPEASGNEQFCEDLPDTGPTIFVLDYLHKSLQEVPVDFRIIRNVTGLGEFAQLEHVEALDDIDAHTVFYQSPLVEADASFSVEYDFTEPGDYIGIVSAGHPTNDKTYFAVFPFTVGATRYGWWIALLVLAHVVGFLYIRWRKSKPVQS
jgi:hypothetical protein